MLPRDLPKPEVPCPPEPPEPPQPPRPNSADSRRWKFRSTSSRSFCDCCGRFQGLRFSPPGSFQAISYAQLKVAEYRVHGCGAEHSNRRLAAHIESSSDALFAGSRRATQVDALGAKQFGNF